MKTLAGVSKHWNKNIFQLLARDKVYKKISICLSLAIQESTNTVAIFSLLLAAVVWEQYSKSAMHALSLNLTKFPNQSNTLDPGMINKKYSGDVD